MDALRTRSRSRVDVTIVPYRETDAERVARLLAVREEHRPQAQLERWRAFAMRPSLAGNVWLAESEGELRGLGWSMREQSHGHASRQFKILVPPAERGRGIGSLLLGAIEARAEPHALLQSEIPPQRHSARTFLERHGFRGRPSLVRMERSTASPDRGALPREYRARALRTSCDLEAWCELHDRAFSGALHYPMLDPAEALGLSREPGFHLSLLETSQGALVGYAHLASLGKHGAIGSLTEIAVDSAHRGRGLGAFLVGRALDHMREQGQTRCELFVEHDAAAPRRLYQRLGFRSTESLECWARPRRVAQFDTPI
jgi:mycothiol synthase